MSDDNLNGRRSAPAVSRGLTTVVGGVGQLYQSDMDLGRRAVARLATEDLGQGVLVEDLHYGAVAVTQFLEEIEPDALVLVGAVERDRDPGTVERRRIESVDIDVDEVQTAVHDAATGYVDLQLVIEVAWGLGALPPRTVAVEVEPAVTGPGEQLSPEVAEALEQALDVVRVEARLAPLFDLASTIEASLAGRSLQQAEGLDAMQGLLGQLRLRDRDGRWGRTFAERDRLEMAISEGATSDDMNHADWGMWWALIEELDRLERWIVEQLG